MYLHIGNDAIVSHNSIIGIFDLEKTSQSHRTKEFLKRAQREEKIETVTDELPASFILCQRDGKIAIYLSQISTATLKKRCELENFKMENRE